MIKTELMEEFLGIIFLIQKVKILDCSLQSGGNAFLRSDIPTALSECKVIIFISKNKTKHIGAYVKNG